MVYKANNYIHCRSEYSLLRGVMSAADVCRRAASAGEGVVGITDINNLYGLPAFIEAAERHGLKTLCGAVVTDSAPAEDRGYLFTAYCTDKTGFQRLNTILSRLHHDFSPYRKTEYNYDPIADLLENGRKGLIIMSSRRDVLQRLREGAERGFMQSCFTEPPLTDLSCYPVAWE